LPDVQFVPPFILFRELQAAFFSRFVIELHKRKFRRLSFNGSGSGDECLAFHG